MNIWIIAHDSQPPTLGRYTRYFYFSKELRRRGYNTRVFAASTVHGTDINLIEKDSIRPIIDINEEGVDYSFVKTTTYLDNSKKRVLNMLEFWLNGEKTIKKEKYGKPDIIIGTSPDPLSWVLAYRLEIGRAHV